MAAVLRQITLAEVSTIWVPRFNTEAIREGIPSRFTDGAIAAAHKDGAVLLVENADVRTLVYCHREPSDPATEVYVNFILALSTHVLDVFLATTTFLQGKGFTVAKFPPVGAYAVQAGALTAAAKNAKGDFTIPLATAKTKLTTAGAK